ncbi:hypothetical protein [Paraburkholderia caballeronis]|uniref:Uncharacterized protein n=1 Tax=Paraburkholderia caballeronis TaxID=416943 RepID=A0A1H7L0G2_9BURK|nr:hypothetical protein [Paraburkholderia caballeronis]PXW28217.1 hypothetical protein C7403_102109 [Paraburkholderia caballeronis]PXX03583.1 hypothetical protein C7407_102109 [Paraburkholderia caballeronis]RAK04327.1 hypothetical protein C7409_102109 [Paraburkholderia caballeronis]SED84684.1 hypothetical protein SAMN05445871_4070 [Paraburkholderia caballeronis]SEK91737.1 hypothetical protein SAMN05192542_104109 [Paraburkholderia caballeronis]
MDKKYGGYTAAKLREFIECSETNSESIDVVAGDDCTSAAVIRDLLEEVDTLREAAKGAAVIANTAGAEIRDLRAALSAPAEATQAVAVLGGWAQGVEAVAKLLDKKADDYAQQYGHDDMGSLSFGTGAHADAKRDYHWSLIELAEEVRAMLAAAPQAPVADAARGTDAPTLTRAAAMAAIDDFEIVGENNDSREPTDEDRFILSEFIAHCFGGYHAPAQADVERAEPVADRVSNVAIVVKDLIETLMLWNGQASAGLDVNGLAGLRDELNALCETAPAQQAVTPQTLLDLAQNEAENALKRQRTRELSERIQQRAASQGAKP